MIEMKGIGLIFSSSKVEEIKNDYIEQEQQQQEEQEEI
jgi:hypothetical protein